LIHNVNPLSTSGYSSDTQIHKRTANRDQTEENCTSEAERNSERETFQDLSEICKVAKKENCEERGCDLRDVMLEER